jgi:hypothetical protein
MNKPTVIGASIALAFSASVANADDFVHISDAEEVYNSLDVQEETPAIFSDKLFKEKSVGALSCLKGTDVDDASDVSYLCTVDTAWGQVGLFDTYKELFNVMGGHITLNAFPDPRESRNPPIIELVKTAGGLECTKTTQPPLEKVGYSCTFK